METEGIDGSGTETSGGTSAGTTGSPTSGAGTEGTSSTPGDVTTSSGADMATSTGEASTGSGSGSGPGDPSWVCPDVLHAVCGVDGETYGNECYAGMAGVAVKHEGPCFGDCEGSCSVRGSPLTAALALVALLVCRRRAPVRR